MFFQAWRSPWGHHNIVVAVLEPSSLSAWPFSRVGIGLFVKKSASENQLSAELRSCRKYPPSPPLQRPCLDKHYHGIFVGRLIHSSPVVMTSRSSSAGTSSSVPPPPECSEILLLQRRSNRSSFHDSSG